MANKVIAWIIGGITTTLMIIILLIAWTAISNALKEIDPNNPVIGQTIDNSNEAVNEVVSWHSIIGSIGDIVFFIGLVVGIIFVAIKIIDEYQSSQYYIY